MKNIFAILPAFVLVTGQAAAAEIVIYRVSGIYNSSIQQTATVIHCTNYDSSAKKVSVSIRNEGGVLVASMNAIVPRNGTRTFSTANTIAYSENVIVDPGTVERGMAVISANTRKIVCSANGIWASSIFPAGLGLHMIRFNQAQGQQD